MHRLASKIVWVTLIVKAETEKWTQFLSHAGIKAQ